ncbi:hypothetical protein C5F63_10660 [Photobacterium damselae subsp. damselae]|uniref:hypothetical protein n=1 Tax=Photobacterium damselae TaxID=38293 RepID=UPI000D06233D|nr:hypothetical protein [Photobacterium damselae]PSB87289.1 hypothetical protein C5F63_10660 [Photobacterium damselae subsp. damselae]TGZ36625.1 hypothetical protein EQ875_00407 [Photobacterium damselae subsp. damselae]
MDSYYKGTHGTTCSAADTILSEGFNKGSGLRGSGVYFWLYQFAELLQEAEQLAIAWYGFESKKGSYSTHQNKSCAVVLADLDTKEEDVFDFESKRQHFMVYAKAIMDKLGDTKLSYEEEKRILSGLHDKFFSDWEAKVENSFDAVIVKVQAPNGFKSSFHRDIASQPHCILVRNENIIKITDVKRLH